MSQHIEFVPNSADIPKIHRQEAETGVIMGIGSRSGRWKVTLKEPALDTNWYIEIEGPNGCKQDFKFVGEGQNSEFIGQTINRKLP